MKKKLFYIIDAFVNRNKRENVRWRANHDVALRHKSWANMSFLCKCNQIKKFVQFFQHSFHWFRGSRNLFICQWFSTFLHTFRQKFFCENYIYKIWFCIKLLGFENCHTLATKHLASTLNIACISHFSKQKCLIVGKGELKSKEKIFGATPTNFLRN